MCYENIHVLNEGVTDRAGIDPGSPIPESNA